jgi:hypothetical protein
MQPSHEVLRKATEKVGVKAVAAELKLSHALVYKWCQAYDANDPDTSGARNPLDRVAAIVRATEDVDVVNWLCHQAGGFFTPNPVVNTDSAKTDLLMGTQQLVKEFSDMLKAVSLSIADDSLISPDEAIRIRRHWEVLKRVAEAFVVAGEEGRFGEPE